MVTCIVKNLILALLIQSRLKYVWPWKEENKVQGNEMTVISSEVLVKHQLSV